MIHALTTTIASFQNNNIQWAKRELSDDEHPVITLLESMGAIEIGPDL